MKKITIAIDGYSSTGKSTLAKQLAKELNYIYVDSGAMYRAVTLFALNNNLIKDDFFDVDSLKNQLKKIHLKFKFNVDLGFSEMYLNEINVEREIRTLEVSSYVSRVSEISEVRKKLVEQQQEMGKNKGVVMDGRDIGTVVFPDAELKLFMTASPQKRATRRYIELSERGDDITYDAILKNVEERDFIDTSRKDSPLVKAKDAIEIDNSDLDINQQYQKVIEIVSNKLAEI